MTRRSLFGLIAAAVTGREQMIASAYKIAGHLFYKIPALPKSGISICRSHMPRLSPAEIDFAYREMNKLIDEWSTPPGTIICIAPDGSRKEVQINAAEPITSSPEAAHSSARP